MDAIETVELAPNEILHPLEIGLSEESFKRQRPIAIQAAAFGSYDRHFVVSRTTAPEFKINLNLIT